MSNLFSIFDPNTNNFIHMNWMSSSNIMIYIPLGFWMLKSRYFFLFNFIISVIQKEIKIILNKKFNYLNSIFFNSLMMFIFLNNFLGLFPYIFTSSSHLVFSLTFSIPLWITMMIFSWFKNTNLMFTHMIPEGTPTILMPFMVMIETISNFIRPSTLAIRLTANMIAGHLLLTLLSGAPQTLTMTLIVIIAQIALLTLEFSVSIIQAYVFIILSTLYTKETN